MNSTRRALLMGAGVSCLVLVTSALAMDAVHEIRPDTRALMSFPVQLECMSTASGEVRRFNVIAPVSTAPSDLNGELRVERGGRLLISTAVSATEVSGVRCWSFYLANDVLDGATFTLGHAANPKSRRSWIFHLRPLLGSAFEPVNNHGHPDGDAPPLSLGRETNGEYLRCRLGPEYSWAVAN